MPVRRLFISFSGGETSAFMTAWIMSNWRSRYDEIVIVFANTGCEREETLLFVQRCAANFGWNVIWVEAVVHHGERKACTHKVVDFASASRAGEPFEQVIAKYGIPNQTNKDCTPYVKLAPMVSYLRSIGWEKGSYETAIGIRADEIDRVSSQKEKRRLVYPLIDKGITKPRINLFWNAFEFRLGLKGYEGNCQWCWKKSLRKHLTIIGERPEAYDFPRRMEALYGRVGPEFAPDRGVGRADHKPLPEGYSRTFFREGRSTDDLFRLHAEKQGQFRPAEDDAAVLPEPDLFDELLDVGGGCEESCEVHGSDDAQLDEAD